VTNKAVLRLDVAVNDVDVVNELQSRTQLNHQLAHVTLCIRVLMLSHVTVQVITALHTTTTGACGNRGPGGYIVRGLGDT